MPCVCSILCQRARSSLWTDGSRPDSGEVKAVGVWQEGTGWEGDPFHLGNNKEVYNTEVYTIYRALKIFEQLKESDRHYTTSSDSASAVDLVRSDCVGPGQHLAIGRHP